MHLCSKLDQINIYNTCTDVASHLNHACNINLCVNREVCGYNISLSEAQLHECMDASRMDLGQELQVGAPTHLRILCSETTEFCEIHCSLRCVHKLRGFQDCTS